MSVLVDTSIWSLAVRRRPSDLDPHEKALVREWSELVKAGQAGLIGPVRQEILSGIRQPDTFERIREHLSWFQDFPLGTADFVQAARFCNALKARGVVSSPIDLMICAVAHRLDVAIFTTDPDFTRYAAHLPIGLHAPGRNV